MMNMQVFLYFEVNKLFKAVLSIFTQLMIIPINYFITKK